MEKERDGEREMVTEEGRRKPEEGKLHPHNSF